MESLIDTLTSQGTEYFFLMSSVFAGVVFFLSGLYFSFLRPISDKQMMSKRLWGDSKNKIIQSHLFKAQNETKPSPLFTVVKTVAGWVKVDGKVEELQHTLYQADILCPPEAFLAVAGILACLGFMAGAMLEAFYWKFALALGLGILPFCYMRIKKNLKSARLEKQMPEGMELLSRSLRAGHTMQSAMELVSNEIGHPLGFEMRIAFEEQRLGIGLNNALRRMSDRVASQDLRFFVTAVLIQVETGGNLAEILENIGRLIRARLQLKGKVKGLTAEGRFSALILGMLPIGIFMVLFYANREYVTMLLTDPLGHKLMMGGIISMGIGILWMKKMIKIQV